MSRTVAGVYADRRAAQRAMVDLEAAGFDPAHITLSRAGFPPAFPRGRGHHVINSAAGALGGAAFFGSIGALAGWAASLLIPSLHGSGFLVVATMSFVAGLIGWLAGRFLFVGVHTDSDGYHGERHDQGTVILTVQAGGREAVARHILARNGGTDLHANRRRLPAPPWRQPSTPRRSAAVS